jgi:hypothetical protein
MSSPSPPSSADWLTAWSTFGAAVGTVGTLMVMAVTLRLQVKANLRGQASLITVEMKNERKGNCFVVHNWSDLPISGLYGEARFHKSETSPSPGSKPKLMRPEQRNVAPHASVPIPLPEDTGGREVISGEITFRDAAGLTWTRKLTGELRLDLKVPRLSEWFWSALFALGSFALAGSKINYMVHTGPHPGAVLEALFFTIFGIVLLVLVYALALPSLRVRLSSASASSSTSEAAADTTTGSSKSSVQEAPAAPPDGETGQADGN